MTSKDFEYSKVEPLQWFKNFWPEHDFSFLTYNPKVKRHFWRKGQGGSDGTLMLIQQDLAKFLAPVAQGSVFYKEDQGRYSDLIGYEIGDIWWMTVYGSVKLRVGTFPGEMHRFLMPVRCVYKTHGPS